MGEPRMSYAPGDGAAAIAAVLEDWRAGDKVAQLWQGDASLWGGDPEASRWLGWLRVVEHQKGQLGLLRGIARDAREAGFRHALLMGMGGSSLAPEVLARTFGRVEGAPELLVLDSTVPAQVRARERAVDLARTLCIVSSKSGGTTEPNVFRQYFQARVQEAIGPAERAGSRFVAVTDPGTKMEAVARDNGFRHVAHGVPSIGGRFSALSNFGMVPAAVMGLDVADFLDRAGRMARACGPDVPPEQNPGVLLGCLLGALATRKKRDKVTFFTSRTIADLGAWLEQLIAESTGKHGVGLIPVDGERAGPPGAYGNDRVFVSIRLTTDPATDDEVALDLLERAGHPVVRIELDDPRDLGQEFFRWEVATAVAGSILGINAFDQPDVEASKIKTRELAAQFARAGTLPSETPISEGDEVRLYAEGHDAAALTHAARSPRPESYLEAHLSRFEVGDYFAVNAYVEMDDENARLLQAIRHSVRDARKVATTLGFGPRFLHSTGQLHKGGPNSGVFLQITSDDAEDLPIPGESYTFGQLKQFQALGDFAVLVDRKRRALRVHLGADVPAGLERLGQMVGRALA